jgi:hypothetical protein
MTTELSALTLKELGSKWRCSISTLKREARRGRLRTIKIGGTIRVTQAAAEEYLAARAAEAAAKPAA